MIDSEFGEIKIRRNKLARRIKLSIGVDGCLRASLPYYAPEFAVKRLITQNRDEIRRLFLERNKHNIYKDGQLIGKYHTLIFRNVSSKTPLRVRVIAQQIIIQIPEDIEPSSPITQNEIRQTVKKVLRKQAKSYLPRRVKFLAEKYGFEYSKLRFSHTGTRWGSCSQSGTISLNITLMNLPHHLIDYVIIHELCHTRQMNHSALFWAEVAKYDPEYRKHVDEIKRFSPAI